MDETTLRKIYTYSTSLAGIILICGSVHYFGPIYRTPLYITIVIILLAIPLFTEFWVNRPIRD